MRFVCRIDREIYSRISADIATDEVVITEKQIEHSNEHANAYDKYCEQIAHALLFPRYIIEDTSPNTGLVIGDAIDDSGKAMMVVLRVRTSTDPSMFKNSIISCWDISEKRLARYIKNRKVIYSSAET